MERLTSGIHGLDDKMEGGFYKGSITLIAGKTGTGKTAFCSSFLYDGAQKNEPGIYVTTEEREQDIIGDVSAMFNWDLDGLQKKKKIKFVSIKPIFPNKMSGDEMNKLIRLYIFDIFEKVEKGVKSIKAKRIVIDSISLIEMFIKDSYLSRVVISQLIEKLKTLGVTALFTGMVSETNGGLSTAEITEYLVDGVIKLDFVPVAEEFKRTLTIRKMRRTDHSVLIHPIDFTKLGVKVIEIKD